MYPAMLDITGKLVTIVGGGKVAYRKAKAFVEFGAVVNVIAPQCDTAFSELTTQVNWLGRDYTQQDLEQSFLVVAATNQTEINQAIGVFCKQHSILCNVVDNRHLSSFIVPAYIKRGDLVISVSTNGKSPYLASRIKQQISECYDESYSEYVHLLGIVRDSVVKQVGDEQKKKAILQHIITLDLNQLKAYIQHNNEWR